MLRYLVAQGTLKYYDINRESGVTYGACECLQQTWEIQMQMQVTWANLMCNSKFFFILKFVEVDLSSDKFT